MEKMICKPATIDAVKEKTRSPSKDKTKVEAKLKKKISSQEDIEASSGIGLLVALEPRIMFDGAALATGAEVLQDTTTTDQTVIPGIDGETSTGSTNTDTSDDALWSSGLTLSAPSDRKEIVFIDTSVDDFQTLMEGIDPNAEVILLDSTRDGIEQIAEILGERRDIDAVHIISHGDSGELRLGTGVLNLTSMQAAYADELATIHQSLTEEADFLIYGCNFGEGDGGQEAASLLAELTGADIAASDDLTGTEALGGDWVLEVQTGTIESDVIIDEQAQVEFSGVLDITTGLVGNWSFDADATDSSGNSNDGTLSGDAAIDTTDATDVVGAGKLSLNGTGDYVNLDAHISNFSALTEGTISAWVQTTDTGESTIFGHSDKDEANELIKFGIEGGQLKWLNLNDAFDDVIVYSTATVNDGAWHHVAVTVNSSGNTLYIDGAVASVSYSSGSATTTAFFDDITASDAVDIGRSVRGGVAEGEFDGLLDETRVYNRALSSSDIGELANLVPTDLEATATSVGGLSLNEDGGNDAYLIADDGGAIIGGLTSLTAEVRFSMDSFSNSTGFFSYATAGDDNVFKFNIRDDGDLSLSINSVKVNSSAMDYRLLADGSQHTLSVTWNSTGGAWEMFVDGYSMDSGSGLETGVTLAAGGTLVMGNDQDSVDGGYDPAAEVAATLYDARIFNDVRSSTEIGDNYYTTVSSGESGLVANWTFNDLTTNGVVVDTVTGNDLTVKHASGVGFVASTPVLTLAINENVSNGTVVGTVLGTDLDGDSLIYTLTDDASGRFTIDSNTGVITVADGSLLNYENNTSHTITVRISDGTSTYDESYTIDVNNLAEGVIVVDTTNDKLDGDTDSLDTLLQNKGADGVISLREAITAANNTAGIDTINFNILDALVDGAHTIQINNPTDGGNWELPGISEGVIIDGTTDSDFAGTPIIELDGSFTTYEDGLVFYEGSDGSIVRGLVINSFAGDGIELLGADNITIEGNYIGTDVTGTIGKANTFHGIRLNSGAADNVIGGTTAATQNVIAGNTLDGIYITGTGSDRNTIQGNYIGVDATGVVAMGNGDDGVEIRSDDNIIGGNTAGARNIISGNTSDGIALVGDNNLVQGNYIGTDVTGTVDLGNADDGIDISGSNNTIGGTTAGARNIISGNADGVEIGNSTTTGNVVQGNYIGTDVTGTLDLGNSDDGIQIFNGATLNTIGGTTAGARNIISGNDGEGIDIFDVTTSNNTIQGNYVGLDATGTADLGNTNQGILIDTQATNNTIGGAVAGAGNVISGNDAGGIIIGTDADGTTIQGNIIGLNAAGTGTIANTGDGITLSSDTSQVGGTTALERNIISGNTDDGIQVAGTGNIIEGNYIGTDITGTVDLGNTDEGIELNGATNTIIGGSVVGARNVIAGNSSSGIRDENSTGTIIKGNYIGVDASGTATISNSFGIQTWGGSSNGIIGGSGANEGNVIGGNVNQGILLYSSSGYMVQGNYIGTDSTGTLDLGNLGNGIVISTSGTNHLIGGTGAGEGNVIAFNALDGITVSGSTATGNSILGNQIYSNTGLGIDLSGGTEDGFGVTDNDTGDADTGANLLQNHPVLTAVNTTGSSVSITGTFNSMVSTTFRVEFYSSATADGAGYGEAERYLGFATVSTDGSGNATINETQSWVVASGEYVTATATVITDAGQVGVDDALAYGNTSEFGINVVANTGPVNTVPGAQVVNEDTLLALSGISVADSDANLATVQLSVTNGLVNISLSGAATISAGGNGTTTLTISGTQADINATLASLTYQGDSNFNGSDTLTILSTDAGALTDSDTVNITVTSVVDVPVISNLGGDALASTEGDGAAVIDQSTNAAVTDVDSADFDTGTFTISFQAGSDSAEDVLAIQNQGTGSGQIGVSGSNVTYEGVTIGTFTGGTSGTNLVITLNANADATAVSALTQAITYENTDTDNPTTGSRTVRYVLTDGDGGTSANYDTTINVTAVNDQATVATNTGATVTEGGSVIITNAMLNEGDPDDSGAGITYRLAADVNNGTLLVGGVAMKRFDNTFTQADIDAGIVVYKHTGTEDPSESIRLGIVDGGEDGAGETFFNFNISVTAVNDGPIAADDPAGTITNLAADPDTIGFWRLGETSGTTAIDEAGNNDGTYNNVTLGATGAGSDTAGDFNGSNAYVDLGNVDVAGSGITMAAWINADTFGTGDGRIFGKSDGINNQDHTWMLSVIDVGADVFLRFRLSAGDYTETLIASDPSLSTGEWYHVAATYDSATGAMAIYLNGEQIEIAEHSVGGAVDQDPSRNAWIGGNPAGSNYFDGRIDEALLMQRSMSASEIAALAELAPPDYSVSEGGTLMVNASNGLLQNDSDVEGDALTVTQVNGVATVGSQVTLASGALITVNADGSFDYDANGQFESLGVGQTTTDSFTYTVSDGNGTDTATVEITVSGVNDAPVVVDDRPGLTFDGIDDFVQIGSDSSLEMTNTMTMEAWFQPTSFPSSNSAMILNKEGEYEVGLFPDGSIRWAFANTDPGWAWHDTGYVVDLNEWTHVAISYNNGTVITYVNGSVVETYNGSGSIGDSHATLDDLRIGGRSNNPTDQYFQGAIGEVRIWNTVRTGSEISTNSDLLLTGNESGLVGNWQLREGSGTSVTDLSSSGNDGALGGGMAAQEPTWVGYATDQDTVLNIAAAGVLDNDVDVDTDPLTLTHINGSAANVGSQITLSSGAFVILNADGSFTYDPNGQFDSLAAGQQASDQFSYTADDGNGETDTATIDVTIFGINDAPVNTVPGAQAVAEDTALNISGLSVNDVDDNLSTVQLDVTQGMLTVTLSGAATISAGSIGSSTLTLSGSHTDINATLASLSYQGTLNYSGADTLTMTSTDSNGATDVDTVGITVSSVNDPPVLTSHGGGATAALSLAENLTGVTTMAATDANGDPLSYSIVGGADAARFIVDPTTGALSFVGAPDFENPSDAGGDNVYDVLVGVSDGQGGTDTQSLALSVTDVMEGMVLPPAPPTPDPEPTSESTPESEPKSELGTPGGPAQDPGTLSPGSGVLAEEGFIGRGLDEDADQIGQQGVVNVLDLPPLLRPASWATTSDQIRAYYPDPLDLTKTELSADVLQQLNQFSDELGQTMEEQAEQRSWIVDSIKGAGFTLTTGFVAWIVRGGALVAGLMSTLPTWRHIDPVPILSMNKEEKKVWAKRVKAAAELEAHQHHGIDQILRGADQEATAPLPESPPKSS